VGSNTLAHPAPSRYRRIWRHGSHRSPRDSGCPRIPVESNSGQHGLILTEKPVRLHFVPLLDPVVEWTARSSGSCRAKSSHRLRESYVVARPCAKIRFDRPTCCIKTYCVRLWSRLPQCSCQCRKLCRLSILIHLSHSLHLTRSL